MVVVAPPTVIVEAASSVDTWIGLVGVLVGAIATGGLNGWLAHLSAHRDRARAIGSAIGDLQAATHTLILTVNLAQHGTQQERLTWSQLILTQVEHTIRASEMIRRLSTDSALVAAAEKWSDSAVDYVDPANLGITREEAVNRVTQARAEFQALPAYSEATVGGRRRWQRRSPIQRS